MASLGLSQDELRAIESTRGRLQQLSSNIASLKADLYRSNPLPPAGSLQASAFILQQNLSSLQTILAENADLFQRVAVHPSTNYPGRTHEGILIQLLRKKPEPDIEGWAEEGAAAALAAGVDVTRLGSGGSGGRAARRRARRVGGGYDGEDDEQDDDEEEEDGYREEDEDGDGLGGGGGGGPDALSEVWADIRFACIERVEQFVKFESRDVYTAEERAMGVENVRTGLKRNLDEDSEDEDEDEDDDDDEDDEDAGGEEKDLVMLDAPPLPGALGALPPGASGARQVPGVASAVVEPEQLLWFAVRGDKQLPASVELRSQAERKKEGGKAGRR